MTRRIMLVILATGTALTVLAMTPYTPRPTDDAKWLVLQLTAAVLAALIAIIAARGRLALWRHPLDVIWMLLVVWLLFSTLWATNAAYAYYAALHLTAFAAVYFAVRIVVLRPVHARVVLGAFVGATALASAYAFAQRAGWDPFPWDPAYLETEQYRNLPGTFGNPNVAGHVLVMAVISAGYLTCYRRWRWPAVAAFVLFIAHLELTHHRAGLVALGCGFVVWVIVLVLARVRGAHPDRFAVVMLLLGAAGGVAAGIAGYWVAQQPMDQSLVLRLNGWYGAAQMIVDRPVLGFAAGHYEIANPPYWTDFEKEHFAVDGQYNEHPHNELLNLGVTGGLFALAAYMALIAWAGLAALYRAFACRERDEQRTALFAAVALAAFFVNGLFGFNLMSPASGLMLPILTGIVANLRIGDRVAAPVAGRVTIPVVAGVTAVVLGRMAVLAFAGQAWEQRGAGAYAQGYARAAQESYAAGNKRAPWSWTIPHGYGRASYQLGKLERASAAFEEGLQRHPNSVPILLDAAQAQLRLASSTDPAAIGRAYDLAARAYAIAPGWPSAELRMGDAALALAMARADDGAKRQMLEQADRHLTSALPLVENALERAYILHRLALVSTDRGELEEALQRFRTSLRLNPASGAAWAAYAAVAAANEDSATYRDDLRKLPAQIAVDSGAPVPVRAVAAALGDEENGAVRAAVWLGELVLATEGAPPAQLGWAVSEVARAVIELPPSEMRGRAFAGLATAAREAGQEKAALQYFEAAAEEMPWAERVYALLAQAEIFSERGDADAAADLLQKNVVLHRNDVAVRSALARALAAAGRTGDARLEYLALLQEFQLEPESRARLQAELDAL